MVGVRDGELFLEISNDLFYEDKIIIPFSSAKVIIAKVYSLTVKAIHHATL
jgi:hypothetical protein